MEEHPLDFTLNDSITQQIYNQIDLHGEEEVNVGYGSQKRKNITTSVGKVDGTEEQVCYIQLNL